MDKALERLRQFGVDSWLAVFAGTMAVLFVMQIVSLLSADELGQRVIEASVEPKPAVSREEVADLKEYEVLTEKGHFGKKQKPPQLRLFGVLGDNALLGQSDRNAKPYSEGASLPGGGKLAAVKFDSVVIEKDGKKKTMEVFTHMPSSHGGRPSASRHHGPPPGRGPSGPKPPQNEPSHRVAPQPQGSASETRIIRHGSGQIPPQVLKKMKMKIEESGMPEGVKQKMREGMKRRLEEMKAAGQ